MVMLHCMLEYTPKGCKGLRTYQKSVYKVVFAQTQKLSILWRRRNPQA